MNTDKSLHERYDDQLKAASEKVLGDLPEESKEQAAAARTQLIDWLMQMDSVSKDPSSFVDDSHANTACNAFEHFVTQQKGKKWETLKKAFGALNDDDQLNLIRFMLTSFVGAHATSGALMTRAHDLFLYENTGFSVDGDMNCVFASVGRKPYQAIGFEDGEHYVGTEGSKTLWTRQFSMALLFPWHPPFQVDKVELEPQRVSDDHALSDKERDRINEVLSMFNRDLEDHSRLTAEQTEERKELEEKMREGIKLARMWIPRFDNKMDELADEHPEMGANFEHVDILQFLAACCEFLQMKLDDDAVRRDIQSTQLGVKELGESRRTLLTHLQGAVSRTLPPEGKEPDSELLTDQIQKVAMAVPKIGELIRDMGTETNILEVAKATLVWLQQELDQAAD